MIRALASLAPASLAPAGLALALAAALPPLAARAGVAEAVSLFALPHAIAFADAARDLDAATQGSCDPAAIEPAYQAAWDAWGPIAELRLGAAETLAPSIEFWPDERGATPRALAALAVGDPAALAPAAFAEQSVAARGLTALDQLLHGDLAAQVGRGGQPCDLMRAAATDLAAQGAALLDGWGPEAEALTHPGAPGNALYLTEEEAFRALFTQAVVGLGRTVEDRLGRPLGSFDLARPTRAEAWRSGRPLRQVMASVEGAADLARLLAATEGAATPDLPRVAAALDAVRAAAAAIDDPTFQDVADPQARLKLEILQGKVQALADAINAEVGAPRGIEAGFNSGDGD